MPSLNKVYLMGNLTRTPELRYTPNGAAICEFGLAVNRRYLSNGVPKDEVAFIDINVWQRQAEICHRRLQKGSLVMVEGRFKSDQWEDKDSGKKRSKILVVAERIHFLAMPPRDDHSSSETEGGQSQPSNLPRPPRQDNAQDYSQKTQQKDNSPRQQTHSAPPPPPPEPDDYDAPPSNEIEHEDNVPF
jgi:single-strand DNA-binding protein